MTDGGNPGRDDSAFTVAELAYLRTQRLARLATVDGRGRPQNSPVGLHYNPETDTIDIVGWNLAASRKYRNAAGHPYVSVVVDDMPVEGAPRGIEIRGQAEALPGTNDFHVSGQPALIRVHPERVISWRINRSRDGVGANRSFPTGRDVPSRRPRTAN
ncbi:PPOX class F420-dependent oxidoreductase [Streptomyces sp. SID3343]|uniref:PPOX class F420-dependent oxidoreductase n=1 Tax=Streptomyces sp. SID3343 TaxID=2690260 RepID=UPI0013719CE4|nr:PPOX class F420-dependent oxidoreductase [Streptomyces sp. SID3343]MYW00963.1 PPOX class F420-dependent oxidoreductase [Streptomyces sp. SID3343]